MSTWSTLNRGETVLLEDAVELQVEKLLAKYQSTLKLHQKGQLEEAKERYEELVEHELLKKELKPKKKKTGSINRVEETPLSTLRFLVFKNYASILEDEFVNTNDDTPLAEKALKYYLQAAKIDPTEHTVWCHVGLLSHMLKRLRFARLAYENGLLASSDHINTFYSVGPSKVQDMIKNNQISPLQWKCLEGLCQVLFDMGDYPLCTFYVDIVMDHYKNWTVGNLLKFKMNQQQQSTYDLVDTDIPADMDDISQVIPIVLKRYDWSLLVESLLKEYKQLFSDSKQEKYYSQTTSRLTQSSYANHSIEIRVEKEENDKEKLGNVDSVMEENIIPSTLLPANSQVITADSNAILPCEPTTVKVTEHTVVDDNLSSHKRKREGEEDGNDLKQLSGDEHSEDENEEDEAEEKRLSLRTFKRQRDKIANEETSRLKMLEEEKTFSSRVQGFYEKMDAIMPNLFGRIWQNELDDSLYKSFWEWFDLKVTELDASYYWDIDYSSLTVDIETSNNVKRPKSLALFIPSDNKLPNLVNEDKVAIKNCIADLNCNNSGIVFSLCKSICDFISHDLQVDSITNEPRSVLDNDTLSVITDTIALLDLRFVEYILSNVNLSLEEKMKLILRTSEYFMDRLIRKEMIAFEENLVQVSSSSRKRVSTSLAKQHKIKALEILSTNAAYWIELLENELVCSMLTSSHYGLSIKEGEYQQLLNDSTFEVRYWSLKGKMAQCQDDIESAYACFTKCKSLVESMNSCNNIVRVDLRSMYDSIIDIDSINKKIELLQVGKLFATAKQKMLSDDYIGVIDDIENIVKTKMDAPFDMLQLTDEDIQMIAMLSKAYLHTNKLKDAWDCHVIIFICSVKNLIKYGSCQLKNSARPCKNDDTEFLKALGQIDRILESLVSLFQKKSFQDWLPKESNQHFSECLSSILKMSIYYMFRHPDFVPFVNNFSSPDVPPHTPSKATKSNNFNGIIVKAWVLQSYLIQQVFEKATGEPANEIQRAWAELLHSLHDELGEREFCGASNSIFLHHVRETLAKVDDIAFRREIYQCYHCLYGVHLAAESDVIEEHYCSHSELDHKAAEPLFSLVASAAEEKLRNGTLLKNDLKDVVETVSTLFEDLPIKHPQVKNNHKIIDDYLNSKIEFRTSLDMMTRDAIISANPLDPAKIGLSPVFFKIFWIRGKTSRIQLKNRSKASNEKLENTIEEYTSHLVLDPNDGDVWADIALCYQILSEIELNWSASNITAQRELLCEYQRKSFHAYMRAIYLGEQFSKDDMKASFYSDFGSLLYSITSSPMSMDAFNSDDLIKKLTPDGKLVEKPNRLPPVESVYKLALILFKNALTYKASEQLKWRCCYMIGKCLTKLDRQPKESLEWFLKLISQVKRTNERKDQEAVYIFYSALVKYLFQNKISAETALHYIATERSIQNKKKVDINPIERNSADSTLSEVNNCSDRITGTNIWATELNQYTSHLSSDTAHVYNTIFQRLMDIRSMDAKTPYHNAVYRISWMYRYVYLNAEKAKNEIIKLFTLNKTVKSHIIMWEQGTFEMPGRRYVHIDKYTMILISLCKEVADRQTLKNLYRKLRRGQGFVIHDKKMFKEAYATYLKMIQKQLQTAHEADRIMACIRSSHISVDKFETICTTFTKEFSEDKSKLDSELYGFLQDLSEIKRLAHGFIPTAEVTQDGFDEVARLCFAVAVFGGPNNAHHLHALGNTVLVEPQDIKHEEKLVEVMLNQAKVLLQNTTVTTR
ncbi:Histone transcription regulator 3 [Choanephora cucurbitarum]|uniref:Histone transcription regulator 3 n=1 Tax=Choanephora cucurbitarum TaxID=101091 RepID=A0A1C7NKN6_9FUNG|nr:Histone transcription regulator 3 [Choanephora cucurbitarum]